MKMFDDKRRIRSYYDPLTKGLVNVGRMGVTKIEVYKENGNGAEIPYLAIWRGDFLSMRTPAIGKDIFYFEEEE